MFKCFKLLNGIIYIYIYLFGTIIFKHLNIFNIYIYYSLISSYISSLYIFNF